MHSGVLPLCVFVHMQASTSRSHSTTCTPYVYSLIADISLEIVCEICMDI